jgi:hypothetical protein
MEMKVESKKNYYLNLGEMVSFFSYEPNGVLMVDDPLESMLFTIQKDGNRYIITNMPKKNYYLNLGEMVSFFSYEPNGVLMVDDPLESTLFTIQKDGNRYIIT